MWVGELLFAQQGRQPGLDHAAAQPSRTSSSLRPSASTSQKVMALTLSPVTVQNFSEPSGPKPCAATTRQHGGAGLPPSFSLLRMYTNLYGAVPAHNRETAVIAREGAHDAGVHAILHVLVEQVAVGLHVVALQVLRKCGGTARGGRSGLAPHGCPGRESSPLHAVRCEYATAWRPMPASSQPSVAPPWSLTPDVPIRSTSLLLAPSRPATTADICLLMFRYDIWLSLLLSCW